MRILPLLLLLAFFVSPLPAATCCDPGLPIECCGDVGDCPTLPSGDCALAAAVSHGTVPNELRTVAAPVAAGLAALPARPDVAREFLRTASTRLADTFQRRAFFPRN